MLLHLCYVGRHVLISASTLLFSATTLLIRGQARSDKCFGTPILCCGTPQYCIVHSGTYRAVAYSFLITGLGNPITI